MIRVKYVAIAGGVKKIFRGRALIVSRGQARLKFGSHVPLAVAPAGECAAIPKPALSAMVMARLNVRIATETDSSMCRLPKVMRAMLKMPMS